jgi:L-alanine-DL-glutamate epimerase-like enolase superfamily enzyme
MARAFYDGWYDRFVTGLPELRDGVIHPGTAPGLGLELRPELLAAPDTRVRVSTP